MSILPDLIVDLQEQIDNIIVEEDTSVGVKKTILFDFEKEEFLIKDGKVVVVEGLEALKIWVIKKLKTEKDRFKIYLNTEYGVRIQDLLCNGYDRTFIQSEIQREIRDALLVNEAINDVNNFSFSQEDSELTVSFNIDSIYGTTESGVVI